MCMPLLAPQMPFYFCIFLFFIVFELSSSSPLWKQVVLLSRWTERLAFLLPSHTVNDPRQ